MNELVIDLADEITFRPENGAFRSRLAEMAVENADEDSAELFSEKSCDIQVKLSKYSIEEGTIRFLVVSDLGEQTLECDMSDLKYEERRDFDEQLSKQPGLSADSSSKDSGKVIVRKDFDGMLDIHMAAQKLGCSQKVLKSKIPCTDYSYIEVNGKKEIQEYYWSQELITQLCDIKLNGVKPEDVKSVAAECCHGDEKWAEELLLSLNNSGLTPKNNNSSSPDAAKQPSKNRPKGFMRNRPPKKKNA